MSVFKVDVYFEDGEYESLEKEFSTLDEATEEGLEYADSFVDLTAKRVEITEYENGKSVGYSTIDLDDNN